MKRIIGKSLITLIVGNLLVLFAVTAHGSNYQAVNVTLLKLGGKAVIVIKKKRTESLNGYLLVVCRAPMWKALEKDSDLGPFIKHKKAASDLDLIVATPANPKDGSTYGIYFQDEKPIGFVEIKTGQGEKLTPANVAKAYVPVTDDPNPNPDGPVRFEIGEVYSDDDQPIPTLTVVGDGPTPRANQPEDHRSGAIKTSGGFMLVWNEPNNYYILEINGRDVKQASTERKFFSVDGMFLQIVDASIKDFVQPAQRQSLDDKAILEAHRDWETKFLEGEYKAKLKTESSWQKLTNGKDALLWAASVPETAKTNVRKQMYLSIVKGDYILLLGGVATDTITEEATQQLLLRTMQTVKTSDKPADLQKLRDTIRKESSGNGVNE